MLKATNYRGWRLVVVEPLGGMAVFFVVAPGPDPPVQWHLRKYWSEAIADGQKLLVEEANKYEQGSRGRS